MDISRTSRGEESQRLAKIGLSELLEAEGGCILLDLTQGSTTTAPELQGLPWKALAASGQMVACRLSNETIAIPRWQFGQDGQLLPGLGQVLQELEKVPGANQLLPLTFLLQPDPITDGLTPLSCLRGGQLSQVLRAVRGLQS